MASIVAGSIVGWSPIDRNGDNDSIKFSRNATKHDLEAQERIEDHSDTKSTDPVLGTDTTEYRGPLSQNLETIPASNVGSFTGDSRLADSHKSDDNSKLSAP
ncbi:hypothetical protein IQ07DRAFT_637517 [Pyrenochaeta sp. DS3sAY3a]|nr:hypothetical protein IQ07DRAFT_637517 [Pyrenochaeta sp. DS3sAY3a]